MKTTVQLDHQTILANSAQPVHLAFQFTAPATAGHRERPIAFSLVLDRSGSMQGAPLEAARRAAKGRASQSWSTNIKSAGRCCATCWP